MLSLILGLPGTSHNRRHPCRMMTVAKWLGFAKSLIHAGESLTIGQWLFPWLIASDEMLKLHGMELFPQALCRAWESMCICTSPLILIHHTWPQDGISWASQRSQSSLSPKLPSPACRCLGFVSHHHVLVSSSLSTFYWKLPLAVLHSNDLDNILAIQSWHSQSQPWLLWSTVDWTQGGEEGLLA